MSVRCALDREGQSLFGFAATLTDDPVIAERLVTQAVLRAGDEPADAWTETVRVWIVRGLLSQHCTLGEPVAADVDEPVATADVDADLGARLAASSRLLRAVAALHFAEHLDAGGIARVVGSTAPDIDAYLGLVRRRLELTGDADALALRRLLADRAATGAARATRPLARVRDLVPPTDNERAEDEAAAARHAEVVELRRRHERAEQELTELNAELVALRAEFDEQRATAARHTAERHAATEQHTAPEQPAAEPVAAVEPTTDAAAVIEVLDPHAAPDRSAIAEEVDAMFRLSVRKPPPYPSLRVVRPLIALTVVLGLNYLIWRWIFSINWSAWFIAVPLVIGETYSLIDSMIFGFTMWRLKRRPEPEPPPEDATVDVFITTYNEPLDLVMKTARAAQRITFPHTLWILDDGNRPELKELAGSEGIGVISRSSDWIDMPRHAKAGNLNNALMVTQGEFIVILDADQVPAPELLDRTLGYFRDEKMAVVQTPQFFVNVPKSDPLGSQAPLFYGPIQQGKDGWNSAFFCGSNAVLRREALLQMGIRRYVHELQVRIDDALSTSEKVIRRARATLPAGQPAVADALTSVLEAARDVRAQLTRKESIADATARFQRRVHEAARRVVEQDLAESRADLNELFELVDEQVAEVTTTDQQGDALDRLARRDWSPLAAIETVAALIAVVDVDREDEAQPIMPMSTISVTEDMATCMRMHSMGWKSAYHDEILAVGLAPEDLGTMLTQRLRWAQGTIQVMLRENPLRQKGLSLAQKVMYLGTMWSYLSGFAALAYIAAPVIYLVFGVLPVHALSVQFFARLIPFLIVNQLLFFVIGRGRSTWRGQQYSLALFPVWIKAVSSAISNVAFGRSLTFAVTPKERVVVTTLPWRLVKPQLIAMGLLVVAAAIGVIRLAAGQATTLGTTINLVWVTFDLVLFSAVIRALFYRGFEPTEPPTTPVSTSEPRSAAVLQEVAR